MQEVWLVDDQGDLGWLGLILGGKFDLDDCTVVAWDMVASDGTLQDFIDRTGGDALGLALVDACDFLQ